MYEAGDDPDFDYITLDDMGYTGGGTLSGDYYGSDVYGLGGLKDIGDGTFTAMKN